MRSIRWLTVILDTVHDVNHIKPVLLNARKDMRNLVSRFRSKDDRADDLRMLGSFETDWYFTHHIPRLSGYKRKQIEDIGFDHTSSEIWLPHLHAIVDLGEASEIEFRSLLERKWPGARRIDIKPLDTKYPANVNFDRLMSYVLKCKGQYKIDPFRQENASYVNWPAGTVAKYHQYLSRSGGFACLRFHMKPKYLYQCEEENMDNAVNDAMPCSIGISENLYLSLYN